MALAYNPGLHLAHAPNYCSNSISSPYFCSLALPNSVEYTICASFEAINIEKAGVRNKDRQAFYEPQELAAALVIMRRFVKRWRWKKLIIAARLQSGDTVGLMRKLSRTAAFGPNHEATRPAHGPPAAVKSSPQLNFEPEADGKSDGDDETDSIGPEIGISETERERVELEDAQRLNEALEGMVQTAAKRTIASGCRRSGHRRKAAVHGAPQSFGESSSKSHGDQNGEESFKSQDDLFAPITTAKARSGTASITPGGSRPSHELKLDPTPRGLQGGCRHSPRAGQSEPTKERPGRQTTASRGVLSAASGASSAAPTAAPEGRADDGDEHTPRPALPAKPRVRKGHRTSPQLPPLNA